MLRARPHREIRQIGQIADAPRSFRLHAVELSGQPPCSLTAEPWWHLELRRNDDQRCAGLGRACLDVEPVISQRQVSGQFESGLSDQPAIEIVWGSVVFQLARPCSHTTVLQPDPQTDRVAVGDVHPERRLGFGAGDDGRRQGPAPVVAVVSNEGRRPLVLGGGGHTERRQHGDQRGFRDLDVATRPVLVLGGDAVAAGKFAERRRGFDHAVNLACFSAISTDVALVQTSRLNRSSQVSRRTTKRALPSQANTTGTRRAPLYWLDIV